MIMRCFDIVTEKMSHWVGHPAAVAVTMVVFGFLFAIVGVDVTNIVISLISLVLLLLLQHTQNRDGAAIQAKLDELIRASNARNLYIGLDRKSEEEIKGMRDG
jgi:low affinity Fe/Cu permease